MIDLLRTMERWHTRKQEHTPDHLRTPRTDGGGWSGDDADTLVALFGHLAPPEDVAAAGVVVVERIVKQAKRAGVCRSARTRELQALLFTAWIDGLGTGLHAVPADAETPT